MATEPSEMGVAGTARGGPFDLDNTASDVLGAAELEQVQSVAPSQVEPIASAGNQIESTLDYTSRKFAPGAGRRR